MKKIIGGEKDSNGLYKPVPKAPEKPQEVEVPADIHIDDLLNASLQIIRKAIKCVSDEVNTGLPSRNAIMNLKDLVGMLRDLKKDEKDILDKLTDEELEKLKNK